MLSFRNELILSKQEVNTMFNELTREDAIRLTKEMWKEIETIFANNTEEELLKEGYENISDIKENLLGENAHFIESCCYLCEYSEQQKQENGIPSYQAQCYKCPYIEKYGKPCFFDGFNGDDFIDNFCNGDVREDILYFCQKIEEL